MGRDSDAAAPAAAGSDAGGLHGAGRGAPRFGPLGDGSLIQWKVRERHR